MGISDHGGTVFQMLEKKCQYARININMLQFNINMSMEKSMSYKHISRAGQ